MFENFGAQHQKNQYNWFRGKIGLSVGFDSTVVNLS